MFPKIMDFNNSLVERLAVQEILSCNDFTVHFGLILTEKEAAELVETRSFSLRENGRIEFGGGVINKIISEFKNSPYISHHNYAETLHELIDLFYYYKNESLDLIGDDQLIELMHKAFDGVCQGSLELLGGRELDKVARNLRFGLAPVGGSCLDEEEEDEDEIYGYEE